MPLQQRMLRYTFHCFHANEPLAKFLMPVLVRSAGILTVIEVDYVVLQEHAHPFGPEDKFFNAVRTLAGSIRASDFVQYLLISAAAVLCLLVQKWWFAPAFKGVFRAEIPLREIGLLCVPFYFTIDT